jgi:hypothetical protein
LMWYVGNPASGTPARRRWSAEEEDALRRALQRFGPGCWKEIKENEPALANRSTVQIKDKVVESSNMHWPQALWIGQFPSLGIYALPLWGLYSSHAMPSRVLCECLCDALRHGGLWCSSA